MIEPITVALETCGTLLTFDQFEVYGIPGFQTQVFYKGEATLYEVDRQEYAFELSTADCFENEIKQDMVFYMEDETYSYKFIIDRPPVADLTGWSKINVNYQGKVAL